MTLQQLKYVIEVSDKGSMNEAAKSLFISQPSLSNAIKELEKELNISIFSRTNKGVVMSNEGQEFLGYARQVVEQNNLLEKRYLGSGNFKQKFSVSTQHYSFAVNAFVDMIKNASLSEYDFTLRETRTYEILDDVKNLRSEIGILYLNDFNNKVITKLLNENDLVFNELFTAKPHVFISRTHPLSKKESINLSELEDYPYLSFEQGIYNSFYYSEEILSTVEHKKNIRVSDRGTLFNLVIGLNGYTICSGVLDEDLNGENIVSVPLNEEEYMKIGFIMHKNVTPTRMAKLYIENILKYI
jgi:DNA-binding transcriptional LysR family regulator